MVVVLAVRMPVACKGPICEAREQPVGVVIFAPSGAVQAVKVGEEACADAQVRCVPMGFSSTFTPGCSEYQVLARRAGNCGLEIDLANGTSRRETVSMTQVSGCSGDEVYAVDPSQSLWAPFGGSDAGSD